MFYNLYRCKVGDIVIPSETLKTHSTLTIRWQIIYEALACLARHKASSSVRLINIRFHKKKLQFERQHWRTVIIQ